LKLGDDRAAVPGDHLILVRAQRPDRTVAFRDADDRLVPVVSRAIDPDAEVLARRPMPSTSYEAMRFSSS
jgi:hypothetical protein